MPIFVASNIAPRNSGKFAIVEDIYVRGGIRVVTSAAARDAIYADTVARGTLKIGMLLVTADDKRIWQYEATNTWVELKKSTTRTFGFSIAGTVWDIPHNTGSMNFTYTVFDSDGFQVLPNECQVVDFNNLRLTFLEELSGTVTLTFNV